MNAIKLFFLVVVILVSSQLYSQIYIQDLNLNEVEDVTMIELEIIGSFSTSIAGLSYRLNVDYGQSSNGGLLSGDRNRATILDKPEGKIIDFRSKMHVINYFENNGWGLLDINSVSQDESQARTFYYFKKK